MCIAYNTAELIACIPLVKFNDRGGLATLTGESYLPTLSSRLQFPHHEKIGAEKAA